MERMELRYWWEYGRKKFFSQYNAPKPELYGRHIDDCIGVTSPTRGGFHLVYNRCQFLLLGSEIYQGSFRHLFSFSRHQNFS